VGVLHVLVLRGVLNLEEEEEEEEDAYRNR
jgi:hypothetical protein